MNKDANININEREIINLFGNAYEIARDIFDVEPVNSSAKDKKQIRKWICKNYPVYKTFPFVNKHTDDSSVIDLIYGLYKNFNKKKEEPKRFFNSVTDIFDKDVISAFLSLIDYSYIYSKLEQSDNNIKIPVDNCASYDRILTLIDCEPVNLGEYDCIDFSGSTFTKNGEHFVITALLENFDTETSLPVVFKFKNAKIEVNSYNATEAATQFFGSPFTMLSSIVSEIIEKSNISFETLNEKEKRILPLLKEFQDLDFIEPFSNEFKKKSFPLIKAEATNLAMFDFVELLESFEQITEKNKEYQKILNKIHRELQKSDYEPLWRNFFNLFVDSQKGYPKKADAVLSKEYVEGIRSEITSLMHQNGFTGNYPNFSKTADLKGVRTADCHGEPFTIFYEKNTRLYISCIEDVTVKGKIDIIFLTGTALNKKGIKTTDAFSCLFYKRGKIFNNSVTWDSSEETEKTLKQIVNIAFKKAELKKLTKDERKLTTTFGTGCASVYPGMGLLFGGLFTLLFAIFAFCLVLFTEDYKTAIEIVKIFPWWQCFIASGGLFGIAMFLISLHTHRK